jgi:hypothetical protein
MVGEIAPLSLPPVVPFRSFLSANLLRACPSGKRASASPRDRYPHTFVFMNLQIPFPAKPLFSHPYKTVGGVGVELPETALPFTVRSVPTPAPTWSRSQIHSFQALAASLPSFPMSRSLFSATCSLFSQNTRGGAGLQLRRLYTAGANRRAASAIGSPTQKMWMTTPMSIILREKGNFAAADSATTTRFIKK